MMAKDSFAQHLKVLLWKNSVLQRRAPFSTALELLLPIAFVAGLIGMWASFSTKNTPTSEFSKQPWNVLPLAPLGYRLQLSGQRLAIVAGEGVGAAAGADSLHNYLTAAYPAFNVSDAFTSPELAGLYLPPLSTVLRRFDSEQALHDHVKSSDYGPAGSKMWAAIVVHTGPPAWDYSIRMNSSEVAGTEPPYYDALQRGADLKTIPTSYVATIPSFGDSAIAGQDAPDPIQALPLPGFTSLQLAMDRMIINRAVPTSSFDPQRLAVVLGSVLELVRPGAAAVMSQELTGLVAAATGGNAAAQTRLQAIQSSVGSFLQAEAYMPQHASLVAFPVTAFTSNGFYAVAAGVMAIYLTLSFLYPVARLIRGIVTEKELKLREGMYMMGMGSGPLLASWLLAYGLIFTVIAAVSAIMSATTFFAHTDGGLVFLIYLLFGWSSCAWAFLVSSFFSRAKTASSIGVVSFLALVFPLYGVRTPAATSAAKLGASICAPTAFGLIIDIIAGYENEGQGVGLGIPGHGASPWNGVRGYSVAAGVMFLAADTVLYLLLGWYFDAVLPREYGVPRPWNFPVTREFWAEVRAGLACCGARPDDDAEEGAGQEQQALKAIEGDAIEPLDSSLSAKLTSRRCISLRGLMKTFSTPDGPKAAVDGVDLDIFEGQILALLGHNGAGKTTTISMITGLLRSDAGLMSVFGQDLSSRQGRATLRRQLGVCPQHNVLWLELTVVEHLQVFAHIKGVPKDEQSSSIEKVIAEVGLTEKRNTRAGALSGGQKRKLSVAIALLGGSKIVVLDEPTSGMDPYSRRFTWQVLQNAREGRVVILTTHFMDEADILGDRIAIMAHGKVRCCGRPLFLKQKFGAGYLLTIQKGKTCVSSDVVALVHQFVPSAALHADVGSELALRIPFDADLAHLFSQLESSSDKLGIVTFSISVTTAEEVFLRVAAEADEEQSKKGGHETAGSSAVIDPGTVAVGPKTADTALVDLTGVASGGSGTDSPNPALVKATAADTGAVPGRLASPGPSSMPQQPQRLFSQHLKALLLKRAQAARRDFKSLCYAVMVPVCTLIAGLALVSFALPSEAPSLQLTTAVYNTDPRGSDQVPVYPNVMPAFTFKSGYGSGYGSVSAAPDSAAARGVLGCIPYPNVSRTSPWMGPAAAAGAVVDRYGFIDRSSDLPDAQALSSYLLNTRADRAGSVFGAVAWASPGGSLITGTDPAGFGLASAPSVPLAMEYTALVNTTGPHTAALYVNLLHSAMYAWTRGDAACGAAQASAEASGSAAPQPTHSITARNHPLPFTSSEVTLLASYMSGSAAVIAMIAWAFIPAGVAAGVVKEREMGAKHQQLLSGVSITAYWLSHFMFDYGVYALTALISVGLYKAFGITDFTSTANGRVEALITVYLLYGSSVIPWTYLLSFLWTSHSSAQNGILIINIVTGVILIIASMILSQTGAGGGAACEADRVLKYFYRFAPGFDLGNSLFMMSFLDILPALNTNCIRAQGKEVTEDMMKPINAWNSVATGTNIAYMAVLTVVYMGAVIGVDVALSYPSVRAAFSGGPGALWRVVTGRGKVSGPGMCTGTATVNPAAVVAGPAASAAQATDSDSVGPDTDRDVASEAARVLSGQPLDDVIVLKRLRKVYPGRAGVGPKVAVQGLSFGIPAGEIFGFLGINGAGKTTTMSVLNGGVLPTSGTASLAGFDVITQQPQVRRLLGYCPQFDTLLDHLTVEEHLRLYARIKGVPQSSLAGVVKAGMDELGISQFANKVATSLSGGNKRKLCVAIALIGRPPLLILDEPTTGVDAVSRRFMWSVLTRIAAQDKQCSIILTTHSMEEAEALCTRIGIMVGGRLRCLGSSTHLKSRFGEGYQLDIRLHEATAADADAVLARLPEELRGTIPVGSLESACKALGLPQRYSEISESGLGWPVHAALQRSGAGTARFVPAAVFTAWWAEEDRAEALVDYITHSAFPGATLLERQGLWLRFRVPVQHDPVDGLKSQDSGTGLSTPAPPLRLSSMFSLLEQAKDRLGIATFALGQTSLEQVFVQFAGQQDEERAPAPGLTIRVATDTGAVPGKQV